MLVDPLDCPRPGSSPFEVRLYNKEVRALIKQNRQHEHFDERWADLNAQVVQAQDAAEARRLAARRYPPDQGFVIFSVTAVASR